VYEKLNSKRPVIRRAFVFLSNVATITALLEESEMRWLELSSDVNGA